jgi:hypothetical protein
METIEVGGQPWQKVGETLSEQVSQACWCMPVIPATQESIGRRTLV